MRVKHQPRVGDGRIVRLGGRERSATRRLEAAASRAQGRSARDTTATQALGSGPGPNVWDQIASHSGHELDGSAPRYDRRTRLPTRRSRKTRQRIAIACERPTGAS